ncbi:MAG: hypothetical protein MUE88_04555 [Flavobacteriales bacterium]|jgi:UDP-N-acetylmuramoylalanine--D-glutamate ligase|nr:hypothetical protein [Flavobacteriales bacterium]
MEHTKNNASHLHIAGGQLLQARQVALQRVQGAAHSLEPVRELDGVHYINDSRATFLDASLASIAAVQQPMVWIAGAWSDELTEGLTQELFGDRLRAVVLFGAGHDRHAFKDGGRVFVADDVRMAAFLAREIAQSGEVVLFSPACPSGNGFANYEERGVEFKRAVNDL